jgi:hypothetical protein
MEDLITLIIFEDDQTVCKGPNKEDLYHIDLLKLYCDEKLKDVGFRTKLRKKYGNVVPGYYDIIEELGYAAFFNLVPEKENYEGCLTVPNQFSKGVYEQILKSLPIFKKYTNFMIDTFDGNRYINIFDYSKEVEDNILSLKDRVYESKEIEDISLKGK